MFNIRFNSDPKYLKLIREIVKGFLHASNYDKDDAMMIVLAVDEAASNIIKYGYDNAKDGTIDLKMSDEDEKIIFVLRDYGKKCDPVKFESRKLDDVRPGGLGLYLMKTIMDDVSYNVDLDVGTELYMTKKKQ